MKKITEIFNKNILLSAGLAICIVMFASREAMAQNAKLEDFSKEVYIQPAATSDILGNTIQAGNRITYEFIKNIAPGQGRWFCTNIGSRATFKWVDGLGETGDGVLACDDDRAGSALLLYVFNNTEASIGGSFEFSGRYLRDADIPDRIGLAYYAISIDEGNPDDNFIYTLRATGTGSSNDNVVRNGFNDGNIHPVGREIFHNGGDHDGSVGSGWQDMYSQVTTLDADWLILAISFGHDQAYDGALENKQLLDNLMIPYGQSNMIAPVIENVMNVGEDSLGVFANEMGPLHLVPAGTEANRTDIEAASIYGDSLIFALPTVGTVFTIDDLANGKYDLFVIDQDGNASIGTQINIGADTYAPLITGGITSVFAGYDDVTATMDEAGTLKLVLDGAGPNGPAVVSSSASEKVLTTLVIPESVAAGQYDLYAIDEAGNPSSSPIDVTVEEPDVSAPVLTVTGKTELITSDTIFFSSDELFKAVYVAPVGTDAILDSVRSNALDSLIAEGVSGFITALSLIQGDYALYSIDRFGNLGSSSTTLEVLDILGPVALRITSDTVEIGFPIAITINEDGKVFVVPEGSSATTSAELEAVAVASDTATANVLLEIETSEEIFLKGSSYDIFAIDLRENISEKLSTIFIAEDEANVLAALKLETEISVFPNPITEILNVKGQDIMQLQLLDLSGKTMLTTSKSYINVDSISEGVYVLRVITRKGVLSRNVIIK